MTEQPDNVIPFPTLEPQTILDMAAQRDLASVIVVGVEHDGTLWAGSTIDDPARMVWEMERLKRHLLDVDREMFD